MRWCARGPLFRTDTDVEPFPQLAKSWEWSADGKQLTMKLMEGVKWSDGVPFNADDVIFTWEDYISDPNVNSGRKADAWKFGDGPAKLEKVDDYTIRWTFGAAKPPSALYQHGGGRLQHHAGAHHEAACTRSTTRTWTTRSSPTSRRPRICRRSPPGRSSATEYKTDELLIMRRNPYF